MMIFVVVVEEERPVLRRVLDVHVIPEDGVLRHEDDDDDDDVDGDVIRWKYPCRKDRNMILLYY